MKPFDRKYIVYQMNASDNPFLSWSETDEDDDESRLMVFDSYLDATKEIIDHLSSMASAVEQGYMGEDSLENELHCNFIGTCSLDVDGILTVYDGTKIILQGPIDDWEDL